jgi:glycosyltransferase involved in cell wall biosynthesis
VITLGAASIVTLLDLIWWHRPQEWERDPRAHRAIRRQALYAVGRADLVFAISHTAAEDIRTTLGVPPERLHVTPLGVAEGPLGEGVAEGELRARLRLGDSRVILCVAQKRPYKNLAGLIRAVAGLEAVLVIPGGPTEHERELREVARTSGSAEQVRFVDWVSDEELEGLYALSTCFVLPSFIEGFGLPVLEAMRRGLPVACSTAGALPEVAGDAALLFNPADEAEIRAAVSQLLDDRTLSARLAERGQSRAAEFSWRRTGEAALAGYRRAISARS